MDEKDDWIGRVRDLAPDVDVSELDTQVAWRRLVSEMADDEAAHPAGVRRGRARRSPRRVLRLPVGAVAAIAAVVVVALIAAGAVVASQLLSRPQNTTGQPDLSAALLPQVPAGEYLRIAQTTVRAVQTDLASGPAPDDSYLVVSETAAFYVPADGGDWGIAYPEESAVLSQVGPHAQEMLDGEGWRNTPSLHWTSELPAATSQWVSSLPHDPDALVTAFSARYGSTDGPVAAAQSAGVVATMLGDPVWFLADRPTRQALVAAVRAVEAFTVTETADGDLQVEKAPGLVSFIDGDTLLPTQSRMPASAFAEGDRTGWPDTVATFSISIVDTVPDPGKLEQPGQSDVATSQCDGTPIPESAFAEARSPATLGEDGAAALSGLDVPAIEPDEWFVVTETPDRVVLMSTQLHAEVAVTGPPPPTHELLEIVRNEHGAWMLSRWTQCALAVYWEDDWEIADVALDPDFPLTAETTTLHLLVTERACASGQRADGRIDVVTLNEFDDNVEILLGVRPLEGGGTCPTNPPTPFMIELSAPLGDRAISDLTYLTGVWLRPPA